MAGRDGRAPLSDRTWAAVRELAPRRIKRAMDAFSGRRDYKAALQSRLVADWIAQLRAADDELKRDMTKLRARSRELSRNNGFAKHYLRLVGDNVIGPVGFNHQARVKNNDGKLARPLNDKIEEGWAEWCNVVTLDGRLSLCAFEKQQLRGMARDGESLVRKWRGADGPYAFALEGIDPDLLDHTFNRVPNRSGSGLEVCMGIEKDERNRPVRYWVWDGPESFARQRKRIGIPADEIIHRYDVERCNQSRGVTWFHPVMLELHMLESYFDSELVASRVGANAQGFFVRREGTGMPTDPIVGDAQQQALLALQSSEPGSVNFAPEGYGLETFDSTHPSTAFGDFVKAGLRQVASGLGITYATLAGDLGEVNYSAHKSGKNDERFMWRGLQFDEVTRFLGPVKAEWLAMAQLRGAQTGGREGLVLDTRDPKKLLAGRFKGCGWPSPDPLKEANAFVIEVGHGVNTCTWFLEERGQDFEELIEIRAEEIRLAAEAGVPITDIAAAAAGTVAQEKADLEDEKEAKSSSKTNGNGNRIAALARH